MYNIALMLGKAFSLASGEVFKMVCNLVVPIFENLPELEVTAAEYGSYPGSKTSNRIGGLGRGISTSMVECGTQNFVDFSRLVKDPK